ncbi:MAG: hypothetical protein R3F11_27995 [Verrucomicrobiales bacterium]
MKTFYRLCRLDWMIGRMPMLLPPGRVHRRDAGASLVLAELHRMVGREFEALHRMPPHPSMPEAAFLRLTDGGFAAAAGHPFAGRVLAIMVERAGFLDTNFEASPEDEEFTTGAGPLNAAYLSFLAKGIDLRAAILPAPPSGSPSRPAAGEPERAEEPSGFGAFCYRRTDLNG